MPKFGTFLIIFLFIHHTNRRELYPDGIIYTSRDSHYSVFKVARLLRVKCLVVGTQISGEMDYADLKELLLANKDKPAILNLNIGL